MSALPDYKILRQSSSELESGFEYDFADSGPQHSRGFHDRQYYRLTLVYRLTKAEWDTYLAHYKAEPTDEHTVTFEGDDYVVEYTAPPQKEAAGNSMFNVIVSLRGYEDVSL